MTNNYLSDLKQRKLNKGIKDCAIFGIIIGGFLFFISSWYYFFTMDNNVLFWGILLIFSITDLFFVVVLPQVFYYPRKLVVCTGNVIFSLIFKLVLLVLYFLVICTIGFFSKKDFEKLFCNWENNQIVEFFGWEDKEFNESKVLEGKYTKNVLIKYLSVISFFVNKKLWFLVPITIIILIFGLIFAFIQNSIITPFIYSLF